MNHFCSSISPICSCRIWISAVWRNVFKNVCTGVSVGVVSRDKDWFCVNINEGFCLYLGLQEQLFIKQLYILYLTTGIHWFTGNFLSFLWSWFVSAFRQTELFVDYDSGCMPYIQYRAPTEWQYNWWWRFILLNSPPYFSINSKTSSICALTSKGLWLYFTV